MILKKHANSKQIIQKLLSRLDVQINGNRPWDIQVHNPDFYEQGFSRRFSCSGGKLHGWLVGL